MIEEFKDPLTYTQTHNRIKFQLLPLAVGNTSASHISEMPNRNWIPTKSLLLLTILAECLLTKTTQVVSFHLMRVLIIGEKQHR